MRYNRFVFDIFLSREKVSEREREREIESVEEVGNKIKEGKIGFREGFEKE